MYVPQRGIVTHLLGEKLPYRCKTIIRVRVRANILGGSYSAILKEFLVKDTHAITQKVLTSYMARGVEVESNHRGLSSGGAS